MVARTELAILDHNSGTESEQAKTKTGGERFKLTFSKVTQNWAPKEIKKAKSKPYLTELMEETKKMKNENLMLEAPTPPPNLPSYLATVEKPNKKEAIKNMKTRFQI